MRYDEIDDYDFDKPGFGYNTGHFTQVVWQASTKLGGATTGELNHVTCRYKKAGNQDQDHQNDGSGKV